LAYNFFEEVVPPPPPPPPAPAPLPPCPPAAVTPGPFLVFFDWDKSLITAEAASILDRAAEQFAATGQTSVVLAGHTDTSGNADYNMRLSQRRADAVKAYLAGKGVPETAMATEAFGQTRLLVETPDNVREPQNRRVEITFSGAPAPVSTGPCTPQ
jgi:outer membrane protein OmpA-like peptidoglycan-associated protein